MNPKVMRPYFLIVLISIFAILAFFIFRPFLIVLALAGIFAMILEPLHRAILSRMSGLPSISALATMLVAIVCILVPLMLLSTQVVSDAQHLYTSISDGSGKVYLDNVSNYTNGVVAHYAPSLALPQTELSAFVDQYIKNVLLWLVQNLDTAFGNVSVFLIDLFVFLIALYYLLRDGTKLKETIITLSPLSTDDDAVVFSRLESTIHSVIRGSLMIGLIQGILTGIGFFFSGIPSSILWGVFAAFAALIPGVGTSLVLVPGVAYLFIVGSTMPALALLLWSIVVVGLIDNLLGPRLVGRGMELHPLVVLLAVFGGLVFFGPAGIFLGPISLAILFSLLSIYPRILSQPS